MQTDPIEQRGGINLYAYVGGDPVNKIDPWGLSEEEPGETEDIITITGELIQRRESRGSWRLGYFSTVIDTSAFFPELDLNLDELMEKLCPIDPQAGPGRYPLVPRSAIGMNFGPADDPIAFALRAASADIFGMFSRAQQVSAQTDREIAFVFDNIGGSAILADATMGAPGSGFVQARAHPNPANRFVWIHTHGSYYLGQDTIGMSGTDTTAPLHTVVFERNGDILFSDALDSLSKVIGNTGWNSGQMSTECSTT